MTLNFEGSALEIIYTQAPILGIFAVEVDGAAIESVQAYADAILPGGRVSYSNLGEGMHTLRILPLDGMIAIDAFRVESMGAPAVVMTPTPPAVPTEIAAEAPADVKRQGVTYIVTNSKDRGAGSLRQAILNANANIGPDTIIFDIPPAGPFSIPAASYYTDFIGLSITDPVVIDGYSQPGASPATSTSIATILIEIDCGGVFTSLLGAANCITLSENGGNSIIQGLAINRFNGHGLALIDNNGGSIIRGNHIGVDVLGEIDLVPGCVSGCSPIGIAVGSPTNIIGGLTPADRNIISGSANLGLSIGSNGNIVQGNYIGTTAVGIRAIPNQYGFYLGGDHNIIGGTIPGARNVISGNRWSGIWLRGSNNIFHGNYIGTDFSGTFGIGNYTGIDYYYDRNTMGYGNIIGGVSAGAGNRIAFNTIGIDATYSSDLVSGNQIYSNTGLGIEINPSGPNLNVNNDDDYSKQNFPVLLSTLGDGGNLNITGTLNGIPDTTFHMEFFANSECDPSGYGEGEMFLGSMNVTTDGYGDTNFSLSLPWIHGAYITATASRSNGRISEFSKCLIINSPPPPPVNAPTELRVVEVSSADVDLEWTNNAPDAPYIRVEYSPNGANLWTRYNNNVRSLNCSTSYDFRVRAFRLTDRVLSAYSNVVTGRTASCAPTDLTVTTLAADKLALNWTDNATDEDEYRIERFGVEIAVVGANETSYVVSGLLCGGRTEYRVRAYRRSDGAFSDRVGASGTTGPCPVAPSSLTATAVSATRVNLTWTDNSNNETKYRVERRVSSVWLEIAVIPANRETYTDAVAPCASGLAYRVQAYDGSTNSFSAYSNFDSVTTTRCSRITQRPILQSPAHQSSFNDTTPTFTWGNVVNANRYDLQVSRNRNFTQITLSASSVWNVYTPSRSLNSGQDGTLYWRVRGNNSSSGDGPWSQVFSFVLDTTIPAGSPVLTRPANGSFTSDTTPTFSWTRVGNEPRYQFQISVNEDCSNPLYVSPVLSTATFTLPNANALPAEDIYYWCAIALDRAGNRGPMSLPFNFGLTRMQSPANGTSTIDSTPQFTWSRLSSGSARYQLVINDEPNLDTPVYLSPVLANGSHTVPGIQALSTQRVYYWTIIITNAPYNVVDRIFWSFLLVPSRPGAPVLSSPANNDILNVSTPDLSWQAATPVSDVVITYDVQIDNNSDFRTAERWQTMINGMIYTLASALADGRWYWRVRTVYDGVVYGPWSAGRRFTIDVP